MTVVSERSTFDLCVDGINRAIVYALLCRNADCESHSMLPGLPGRGQEDILCQRDRQTAMKRKWAHAGT